MRALLVVDHGSRRQEANAVLSQVRQKLEAALGPSVLVEHAHMELATPNIGDAVSALLSRGATELFVLPWFLAPGRHSETDVPALVRAAIAGAPLSVRFGPPMGADDALIALAARRFEGS